MSLLPRTILHSDSEQLHFSPKGIVLPDYIYLKVIWLNRPRLGYIKLELKIYKNYSYIFIWPLGFLSSPR